MENLLCLWHYYECRDTAMNKSDHPPPPSQNPCTHGASICMKMCEMQVKYEEYKYMNELKG